MLGNGREQMKTGPSPTSKSAMDMDFNPHVLDALDAQIGRRIRLRRRLLGLNQTDLAARIGVTFQQVHKYETGQSAVTAVRLYAIAAILGSELDYFYEEPTP